MTKYTAADFANAQFAEDSEGNIAARMGRPNYPWVTSDSGWEDGIQRMTDRGLEYEGDWTPVTPAATITDSDVENLCGDLCYDDTYLMGFIDGFESAGGTILDDPTNLDRLKQLHESWIKDHGAMSDVSLVEYLDQHGVRAEEVK